MRIGHGYDAHRYKAGRACVLCGVRLDSPVGPDGHSDADVPVHALMDALLGAAALGDIGAMFPDSDPKYDGASSVELLKAVTKRLAERGYTLCNADITIIAQSPRLSPYIARMRENIAAAVGAPLDAVSVKATTEEKMGFTGSGEGIAAHAVVLIDENCV